ncbi:MAG: M20 family peptidase [Bacteroidota bacterium]
MKKLRRLLFRLIGLSLLVVTALIGFNTFNYTSRQIEVAPVAKISIDDLAIQRLAEATRIPTVSFEDRIDTAAFLAFNTFLDTQFVWVDSLLEHDLVNTYSHVYKWTGRKPGLKPILLMAHIDVVPVEEESQSAWTHPPYSGAIADEYIWGRGTLDDKVNMLGVLEAFESLLRQNYQPERSIYLACGHDEEVGGREGAMAIARWFRQQDIEFEYILDEGGVILEKALPGLEAPLALIGTCEKGFTTLSLSVNLEKGGHSSMPPSETAIGIISKAIAQLEANPFPEQMQGPIRQLFDHAGPETQYPYRMIFANLWLFEGLLAGQLSKATTTNAAIRTTIAPTLINAGFKSNVLPTSASATINLRIIPGETISSVIDYVKATIDDPRVQVQVAESERFMSEPSVVSGTSTFGFRVIQKTSQEIFPHAVVAPSLVIAATDSRHYEGLSDQIFRFFAVQLEREDLSRIHGLDERIGTEAYRNLIRFYHQLILNSCK